MKIFVSISAYDAILDASIASILCKKLLIMKSIQVYHIVMKILIKRILKNILMKLIMLTEKMF